MRVLTKILAVAAVALFAASFALAATLTGTVKGPDGAAFRGAFVEARNSTTKITYIVLSDKEGHYRADSLPAGDYRLQIRAPGYRVAPVSGLALTADQNATHDFDLQKGMVRWSDLSYYQGIKLFPDKPGKEAFVGTCFGCHGFESRMASTQRDEDGWRDRVNYMREIMHFALAPAFTDAKADQVVTYLTSIFGPDSILPKSPTEVPGYNDVQLHFPDSAMNIVYVQYDMPGPSRMPWDGNPAKDGSIWIPEFSPFNGIARLNPETGEIKEWKAPNQGAAAIHSAVEGPDGDVWFTEQASNKLGRWDHNTQQITEYQAPMVPGQEEAYKEHLRKAGSKHTLRVGADGIVWSSGTPFSSFDPKTQKFTMYPVAPNTYGIDMDKEGNVWFDGFTPDGKLFRVDGKTHKITGYQPPTAGLPRRIQAAADGTIWFCEFRAGKLAHFDPKTETFKEYPLPGGTEASPYALGLYDNAVWYSSEHLDEIGRLDPATGKVTEYPVPMSENAMREFLPDASGKLWWASPPNNKVGYFYLSNASGKGD